MMSKQLLSDSDTASQTVQAFRKKFGEPYYDFACHAAFVRFVTPEILYILWNSFQISDENEMPCPWFVVSDLLASDLCEQVGIGLYEFPKPISSLLICELSDNHRFGRKRIGELAEFLTEYSYFQSQSADIQEREFSKVLSYVGLAYKNPKHAARVLREDLEEALAADEDEALRIISIVQDLKEPLSRERHGRLLVKSACLKDRDIDECRTLRRHTTLSHITAKHPIIRLCIRLLKNLRTLFRRLILKGLSSYHKASIFVGRACISILKLYRFSIHRLRGDKSFHRRYSLPLIILLISIPVSILLYNNTRDRRTISEPSASESLADLWKSKSTLGIYVSRYQVTGSASEKTIRDRVRYYKNRGINTIVHGVWGNGCPMYKSEVMQQKFGIDSCLNAFQEEWLDWLIDEAERNDVKIQAYFEKGITIDRDSPIFAFARDNGWLVPGIDRTYEGTERYLLNVNNPDVYELFADISAELVQRYPSIEAIQWDDYLSYPGDYQVGGNSTLSLTQFVQQLQSATKQVNPTVDFNISHHNPYWSSRYFNADWTKWNVDMAFIQVFNDANFENEVAYAENYSGVVITENQLHRLDNLLNNEDIESILIYPSAGSPEEAIERASQYINDEREQ